MAYEQRTAAVTDYYAAYLRDPDTARFIQRVSLRYTLGSLARLAESGPVPARRGALMALDFLGDYELNAVFGRALHDHDRHARLLAEDGIRKCWRRIGDDSQQQQLAAICRRNTTQHFGAAAHLAREMIRTAPWIAEAWNQRAIAMYSLGRPREAIADCQEALEINPYHFDAAAGMAQCHLQLGEEVSALECLRRALRLNPGLEGVRAGAEQLERLLKNKKPRG